MPFLARFFKVLHAAQKILLKQGLFRGQKINLVDLKVKREAKCFAIFFFENSLPPLEKILDPPLLSSKKNLKNLKLLTKVSKSKEL